jgi:HAMP domain-containing protein
MAQPTLVARPSARAAPGTYRLAPSIRVPWAAGLAMFIVLGIVVAIFVGRVPPTESQVPRVVLDYQEALTRSAAEAVRRGMNEGVYDLEELAALLETPGAGRAARVLTTFRGANARYTGVFLLDADRDLVASVGVPYQPRVLPRVLPGESGMFDAVSAGGRPLIQQYASLATNRGRWTLVAYYDPRFLRFALELASPGEAFVVDRGGRMVGTLRGSSGHVSLRSSQLRAAARRGSRGRSGAGIAGGSIDRQEIIAFTPVSGAGPAGSLGWSVVTDRSVASLSLPTTLARRQAVLAGIGVVTLALAIFLWLYVTLIRPILRLQREAERVADGQLSKPVEIIRFDEIGLVARAIERIRIFTIRGRVRPRPPPGSVPP